MKVKESLDVKFDESHPPIKLSPLVDDDVGKEEAIENNTKVVNNSNKEDESIEVDEVVNIKESKNHPLEQVIEPKNVNEALGDESWVIAMLESIRILLAIAFANDFKLYQMEEKSAFLNGFINEEVYVAQPLGFIDFEKPNMCINSKRLCMVLRKLLKLEFEVSMMEELNFFLGLQIKQMEDGIFFYQSKYIKEMLKKFGLEDSKPTKIPMSTEIKLTKDDEADSVDYTKYRDEEGRPYIEFKLGQFTFELDTSQLSRIFQAPKVLETFYISKWSLNSLDDHPNSRFFGPKHDFVKKNITIPRTTETQLQRNPNKLYIHDLRPELRGWELFLKENFFCTIGNRDHVNACTAYMLYYLTIKRKFNFTTMILYRIEEVKKNNNAPMPFAMLLTRLYNHILQTNPQAIVPLARFMFHEHVMNLLDISRNPTKEKGKRVASLSASCSLSSSSDENETPSFLEFYE
ncbi:retrovirus-related pol polyprotein from transposon TNT 1-94 [Tanacetum coccineum]